MIRDDGFISFLFLKDVQSGNQAYIRKQYMELKKLKVSSLKFSRVVSKDNSINYLCKMHSVILILNVM